jgi:phage terminase large subunit GpA-like protein
VLVAPFAEPREVTRQTSEIVLPPRRMRPSAAAAQSLRTEKGPWDPDVAPMLLEPLDMLGSREYTGIVFVGPARTGKTMGLILGGITYIVTCAPGDALVVGMSQDTVRDFSRTDLDRAIRYSPELEKRLSPRARDDNTYDKFFRSGIVLKLGWPAVSQLSAKTLQYVFLTDYDRPENRDDVDGEGPMYDLAAKRVETYMSRGKCVAESSPGEDWLDPKWQPTTPHEAPPALGILSLYNRGTRARWYWPCKHCRELFEAKPGLDCFAVPGFDELTEAVQRTDPMTLAESFARVVCPRCGGLHEMQDRPAMNRGGVWLHEGQRIEGGRAVGDRRRTNIASYWLGGVAAAYQRWDAIVLKYLQGVATYARTGDETALKATTNTDQGAPYIPRAALRKRGSDVLRRRLEDWPRGKVPAGVRFLTASVDVQGNRFVVSVFGWGVGLESWLVERFAITASRRPEGDRFAALDPASYAEDWDVLREQVIERKYPVDGVPGAELGPLLTLCDSGGREGVTENAYKFSRALRRIGLGKRFNLVKGVGDPNTPRVRLTWPDSTGRKDRHAGGRGDVPVWLINANVLKDGVSGDLGREVPGPGYHHIPQWVDPAYFDEIAAEDRTAHGWRQRPGERNEAFDLHVYARAACIVLGAERINWDKPPSWAAAPVVPEPPPDAAAQPAEPAASAAFEKRPQSVQPPRKGGWVTRW